MVNLSEIEQLVLSIVEENPGRLRDTGVIKRSIGKCKSMGRYNGDGVSEEEIEGAFERLVEHGEIELRGPKRLILHGGTYKQFCYLNENGKKEVV